MATATMTATRKRRKKSALTRGPLYPGLPKELTGRRPTATKADPLAGLLFEAGRLLNEISSPLAEARATIAESKPRLYAPLVSSFAYTFTQVHDLPDDARKVAYRDLVERIRAAAGWTKEQTRRDGEHSAAWSTAKSLISQARSALEWMQTAHKRKATLVSTEWAEGSFDRYPLATVYNEYRNAMTGLPEKIVARIERSIRAFVEAGGKVEQIRTILRTI